VKSHHGTIANIGACTNIYKYRRWWRFTENNISTSV
jgi:hypothetical protein